MSTKYVYVYVDSSSSMREYFRSIEKGLASFIEKIKKYDKQADNYKVYFVSYLSERLNYISALDSAAQIKIVTCDNERVTVAGVIEDIRDHLDNVGGGYLVFVCDGVLSPKENRDYLYSSLKRLYSRSDIIPYAIGFLPKDESTDSQFALYRLMDFFTGNQLISVSDKYYESDFEAVADLIVHSKIAPGKSRSERIV